MNRQIVAVLLSILSVISFTSCSDSPSSIGSDLLSGDGIIVSNLNSFTDSLQQSSSFYRDKISLGNSSRLFLGKKNNFEASILLKFFYVLPDSLIATINNDSLSVIQAKLRLSKGYVYSKDDESLPIDFTVHKVNSSWTANFTEDSLQLLNYDMTDLSSDRSFSDTLYSFILNSSEAMSWLEESADTSLPISNGIYILPSQSSQKIVGFEAFSEGLTNFATLETVFQRLDGLTDTLYATLIADVSILKETTPIPASTNIILQAGLGYMSELSFDLSSIPKNAVINYAELQVTKDTLSSVLGDEFTNSLLAFFVVDSATNELDSTTSAALFSDDTSFSGNITTYAQRWQSGESNQGLLLIPSGLVEGLELFVLRGSTDADISKRPRLKITYTTIKQ
ncbi:MAG: hypothetical protein IPM56_07770 [Ignavibacteriales bacterium]|nr:MAG: hypothetical protein IPM56_07770 [Ignavibacteriales bacterium]